MTPPKEIMEKIKEAAKVRALDWKIDMGAIWGFTEIHFEAGAIFGYSLKANGLQVEEDFFQFITNERDDFVKQFWKEYPDAKQRVIAENLLIAYDQMKERLKSSSKITELEKEIERLKGLIYNAHKSGYKSGEDWESQTQYNAWQQFAKDNNL